MKSNIADWQGHDRRFSDIALDRRSSADDLRGRLLAAEVRAGREVRKIGDAGISIGRFSAHDLTLAPTYEEAETYRREWQANHPTGLYIEVMHEADDPRSAHGTTSLVMWRTVVDELRSLHPGEFGPAWRLKDLNSFEGVACAMTTLPGCRELGELYADACQVLAALLAGGPSQPKSTPKPPPPRAKAVLELLLSLEPLETLTGKEIIMEINNMAIPDVEIKSEDDLRSQSVMGVLKDCWGVKNARPGYYVDRKSCPMAPEYDG